jgi:hypothetical protein
MTEPHPMRLVWPAAEYLPSYVEALKRGWSPNNVRPEAGRDEMEEVSCARLVLPAGRTVCKTYNALSALGSGPDYTMAAIADARLPARRRALCGVTCCAAAVLAGCYHYAPVPVSALEPAMTVKLELSAVAVDRIRRGPDSLAKLLDGFTVSGTVSELRGDSVLLSVPTSYMEANVRLRTQMHAVPLLRSDVQRVTSRQLDRARTTWTGVAFGALAAGSVAYVLSHGGEASGSSSKPVDPSELRAIPVP